MCYTLAYKLEVVTRYRMSSVVVGMKILLHYYSCTKFLPIKKLNFVA
jgi:hypothetical protein